MPVDHAVDIRRTCTALALALPLFAALYLGGWFLFAAIMLISAIGLWEFYSLFWPGCTRICTRLLGIVLGWGMLYFTWIHRPQDALVFLGAGFVAAALNFLFRWDVLEEESFVPGSIFLAGLAYVPLLLLPATYLGAVKLSFIIAAVCASDIAAYFVGTRFGRHKLWPRVSPNKSSEGALGSLAGCIAVCCLFWLLCGQAPLWQFVLLGVLINAFAQLGDLFESALKRAVHVKDSSNLLPGHGGILDRADSVLFAMPIFAVVDQWFTFF